MSAATPPGGWIVHLDGRDLLRPVAECVLCKTDTAPAPEATDSDADARAKADHERQADEAAARWDRARRQRYAEAMRRANNTRMPEHDDE